MSGCRIQLVTKATFADLKTNHHFDTLNQNAHYPWQSKNIVSRQKQAFTEEAWTCNAGGIQNGKQVTFFHLDPESSLKVPEKNSIQQKLNQDTFELQQAGKVRGLIAGGVSEDEESQKLEHLLEKTMKQAKVTRISKIWGRKSIDVQGPTNVMYRADKNTWYVNAQLAAERNKDILTLEDLYRTFDTIELAKGDELVTEEGTFTSDMISPTLFQKLGNLLSKRA